ncbi:MAG TPA: 3-methyl-2-oxobutanoate hydroxymethyltransferase [Gammaproteobacteria bacterium]|nr:3-methyl-2-oxobutanoate hydroxymethyltransferase [Gammaproteobacteria bacterium]
MGGERPVSTAKLREMKAAGKKIVVLTAYESSLAALAEAAGVDVLLVGDSLGMVIQGHDSTLPVTLEDMVYHGACVARASRRALRVIDMPFLSYATVDRALDGAGRLMREGGAQMVKLEGGAAPVLEVVRCLTGQGIPVCGHLGLTPQSVHQLGGYRVQGREAESARQLREAAAALEQAGASLLVLECVPEALAAEVCSALSIPVIGIGAGAACDGQVLVVHDLLGMTPGGGPRFAKNFLRDAPDIPAALAAYVSAVREGRFPGPEHTPA